MDIPAPPEDGTEPVPIDEERKAAEFKMYEDFAYGYKLEIEETAADLMEYHVQKDDAGKKLHPLWPIERTPEEKERIRAAEDLRASKE